MYPNPIAVADIAGLFELSKPGDGLESRLKVGAWIAGVNEEEHAAIVIEELREAMPNAT